jgi:hypothetical protein
MGKETVLWDRQLWKVGLQGEGWGGGTQREREMGGELKRDQTLRGARASTVVGWLYSVLWRDATD